MGQEDPMNFYNFIKFIYIYIKLFDWGDKKIKSNFIFNKIIYK